MATQRRTDADKAAPVKDVDPAVTQDDKTYKPVIVTLQDDPWRKAAVEKRQYEAANPETVDWSKRLPHRSHSEFGGPLGCAFLLIWSHSIIWYFTLCLQCNQGALILPHHLLDYEYPVRLFHLLCEHSAPTVKLFAYYWIFLIVEGIFAVTLPGAICLGEPIPSLKGQKLTYICNAVAAFWATMISIAILHFTDIFPLTIVVENVAPLATVAMLSADFIGVAIYFNLFGTGAADPDISHNFFYDFFMGRCLNPRIGPLDIKMFFEIRVSWIMMTLMTTSATLKFYQTHGYLSNNIIIITTGMLIYCYSIMKGENYVLPTWDITTEFYGHMLCFWNSGLPFIYSAQSVFILRQDPQNIAIPDIVFYAMMIILLSAYYCFDTVNAQKNSFRQHYNGTYQPRPWAFPQFKYGVLENPRYLRTKAGTPLLLDGWYRYARKWQYTTDVTIATMWCFSCGFNLYFLPKFYMMFFVGMLFHRCLRDEEKCARKYGKDWEAYCSIVKYRFIPFVY